MSGEPAPGEDLDDAAFRARLAPLAREILPPEPAVMRDKRPLPRIMIFSTQSVPPVMPDTSGRALAIVSNVVPRPKVAVRLLAAAGLSVLGTAALIWLFPSGQQPETIHLSAVRAEEFPPWPANPKAPARPSLTPPRSEAQPPMPEPSRAAIAALISRGQAAAAEGDIAAARLLFERAAGLGSAQAAMALGKTYDSAFLREAGVRGIPPDPAIAESWYRKAASLGGADGRDRLAAGPGR